MKKLLEQSFARSRKECTIVCGGISLDAKGGIRYRSPIIYVLECRYEMFHIQIHSNMAQPILNETWNRKESLYPMLCLSTKLTPRAMITHPNSSTSAFSVFGRIFASKAVPAERTPKVKGVNADTEAAVAVRKTAVNFMVTRRQQIGRREKGSGRADVVVWCT